MDASLPERTEIFIRYIRGSLYLSLACLGVAAAALAALALDVDGTWAPAVTRFLVRPFPLLPVLMAAGVALNMRQLKGHRFRREDPALRAVLEDEQRREAFHRAFRAAFITTLVAQFPLGALFVWRPAIRLAPGGDLLLLGPLFMGAFTLVVGLVSLICFFLFFDRD